MNTGNTLQISYKWLVLWYHHFKSCNYLKGYKANTFKA